MDLIKGMIRTKWYNWFPADRNQLWPATPVTFDVNGSS
jgi:hypothetical protein